MFLIDTDVLSAWLKPGPPDALLRRMEAAATADLSISSITVGEISYGAWMMPNRDLFLDRLLKILSLIRVHPFDTDAALAYGKLKSELRKAGRPLDEPDLRIASIALARNLTLVTANTKHFGRIGALRIENWLK